VENPQLATCRAYNDWRAGYCATVATIVGEDRPLYASDYAHFDCLCPESVKAVAERDDLSPTLQRKVLGANAARLFNLKL